MPLAAPAIAVLRARGLRPSARWESVYADEHAKAFAVAQMTRQDQLLDVRSALILAQKAGTTPRQFVNNLTYTLVKKGWAPQGRGGDVPTRLDRIFSTNRRVANAAGHWRTAEDTKDTLPFLLYELGPSAQHRDAHVAIAGTLLPIDDKWWDTHYPPNGWGCKCRVRQVGRAEHKKLSSKKSIRTTAPPVVKKPYRNKATGKVAMVPEGIDPGWEYNIGAAPWRGVLAQAELAAIKMPATQLAHAKTFIAGLVAGVGFRQYRAAPVGREGSGARDSGFPLALLTKKKHRADGGLVLAMGPAAARAQRIAHPGIRVADYLKIQELIDSPAPLHFGKFTTGKTEKILLVAAAGDQNYAVIWERRTNRLLEFRRMPSGEAALAAEIQTITGAAE